MDKVKIQEIADEVGMSNSTVLAKAKELGFNVKVANSTVTTEQAQILMDYVINGKLPNDLAKSKDKSKKEVSQDRDNSSKEQRREPQVDKGAKDSSKEETKEANKEKAKETPKESKSIVKKPKKRAGITTISKSKKDTNPLPQKLKRVSRIRKEGPITIVKKAKPTPTAPTTPTNTTVENLKKPTKEEKLPSLEELKSSVTSKKRKKKGPAEAKSSGEKLEILNERDLGATTELYEEEEIVLLDFSDKNIFEEQQRQEERRKAEAKKRANLGINQIQQKTSPNRRSSKNIKRNSKKRKTPKNEANREKVSVVKIPEDVRVYEFAEKVGKSVGEVVKVLFNLGTMVTKNDFLDKDSIEILAEEFGVQVETINPLDELDYVSAYDAIPNSVEEPRPPVITIMGHVDHGKTSLLDYIRSTRVAEKEAGGITQHVGAYQVEKDGKKITFIDTPGHSAFTQMRARGAQATDIAIIVVAADDGVMPQTKESISHAKAANVPIIIALTKIDKPTANPDNVKSQLAEIGIIPIEWGGEYEMVEVSSHTGEGIDDLLETILLQAEMMELTADPTRKAKAIVIESSVEKGFGPVANVIIKNGTLKVGDSVIVGSTFGRVRTMILDDGSRAKSIPPSTPAAVIGLQETPQAGEILVAMNSEKEARELAQKRKEYLRAKELSKSTKVSIDELGSLIAEGKIKKLPLIVKADVQGSLEAIKSALDELKNEEVKVEVIHGGVGGITESDVLLADASENAIIVGFNVRPTGAVKKKAQELGIEIKTYSIIYDMIDDVKALLSGLMSPVIKEEVTGQAEVRETFVVAKVGTIAGCMVTDGVIERNSKARLIRDGVVIYTSKISSLKRFSDDVKEVKAGYECGLMLENFNDIKVGDVIETFKEVEEQAKL